LAEKIKRGDAGSGKEALEMQEARKEAGGGGGSDTQTE
jgi:hypothetical protein